MEGHEKTSLSLEVLIAGSPLLLYQSIEDDDRPATLAECLDENNQVIQSKHTEFLAKEEELEKLEWQILAATTESNEREENQQPEKKKRMQTGNHTQARQATHRQETRGGLTRIQMKNREQLQHKSLFTAVISGPIDFQIQLLE